MILRKRNWIFRGCHNKNMNRQMTLAEMNDEFGAARTNKKEFLNKMDSVIPWETFVKEIEP